MGSHKITMLRVKEAKMQILVVNVWKCMCTEFEYLIPFYKNVMARNPKIFKIYSLFVEHCRMHDAVANYTVQHVQILAGLEVKMHSSP